LSSGLKQRIAGAFVLGALGLIILPLLFDFADPNRIDRNSKLPPAPEIAPVSVAKAERPAAVSDQPTTAEIFDIERSTEASDSDEKPYGLNELGLPNGWILQVGSFEEPAPAALSTSCASKSTRHLASVSRLMAAPVTGFMWGLKSIKAVPRPTNKISTGHLIPTPLFCILCLRN
jgi:cell division septation protein DedD